MSSKRCPRNNIQLKKIAYFSSKGKSLSNVGLPSETKQNITSLKNHQPLMTFFENNTDSPDLNNKQTNHEHNQERTGSIKKINNHQALSRKGNQLHKRGTSYTSFRSSSSSGSRRMIFTHLNLLVTEFIKTINSYNLHVGRNHSLNQQNRRLKEEGITGHGKENKSSEHFNTAGNLSLNSNINGLSFKLPASSFNNISTFYNHLSKHLTRGKPNLKSIKTNDVEPFATASNGTRETANTDKMKNKTVSHYYDDIDTPEELHYHYVNMLQNGNEIALKFDKE